MNTLKTQPLPPLLTTQYVPCTLCGLRHERFTQYLTFPKIGTIAYDACCIAHDATLVDHITRKFEERSFEVHVILAQKITDQQQEIEDLKQLLAEWKALIREISRVRTNVNVRVWTANRDELLARTVLALRKEVKQDAK